MGTMKVLVTGISFLGSPLGSLEGGLFTGDFERRMKGAVEMERLSLREFCEVNVGGGGFRYWGRWMVCRKGSGDGHLSP